MNLHDIFAKAVDRPIEGVIKADDLAGLKLEVEEYVFTNEISKRLGAFLEAYTDYQGANGVWISGFFGSGKSHLLKMLALLLENYALDGKPVLEFFLPKCGDDAMLQGDMRRAVAIPSKSILFNIDQKADTISKTEIDAVLSVFVKVFNEMQGYYGKQGYVAQFERDLDDRRLLDSFKQAYGEIAGQAWEQGREQIILEKQNISEAYARISGSSQEAALGIIDKYRADYKLSIEDFAELVNAYIKKQEPGFRLNFFVDEVGQYIADNVKLMTNLQTIAESLATKCQGRAWLVVTAQEDMNAVLGEFGKQQSNDFTKIQARFKTRMKLTSANVDEVIQKRLLKKNATGESYLARLYGEERNNFGTLFDFADGSVTYRNFRDEQHFIDSYPFIPYQFTLFQSAIENLSKQSAFEGRHSSVGERSMLGVFQQVVVEIAAPNLGQNLGQLATFDLMFEGIRTVLKAQNQRSILNAEQHLADDFAVQILKALFLVKYVKEFKATPRNIRVLMFDRFDEDLPALSRKIEAALNLLEQQTYIQQNGEAYEFLTDEEKDIEQEIKTTDVDDSEVVRTLEDILFADIIKDRKIRYEATGQDFPFTKKMDDHQIGREQELAIHFITPFHEHVDHISILQANSLGRAELMLVMPPDDRLVRDLNLYKKTEKYIRQNLSTTQQETVRRILSDKSFQNKTRLGNIKTRSNDLIAKATILVSGEEAEIGSADPRSRIILGFTELVVKTYPHLKMLRNVSYNENDITNYLDMTQSSLFGGEGNDFSEAEQEILAFIQANNRAGVRTTLKSLETNFGKRPYGWYLAAIQCVLAKLCGRGKVEVRSDGNLLENQSLERALKNTHGFPNVILEPQIDFTASQVRNLKDFYSDFFDRPPAATEARALGKETGEAFKTVVNELEVLAVQSGRYPFLSALDEPLSALRDFVGKPYTFFLTELGQYEDPLLDQKEEVLDPVRRFMSGANKSIYDEARDFTGKQEPNFTALNSAQPERLRAILIDPNCYKGNQMQQARSLTDELKVEIEALVQQEQTRAIATIDQLQTGLHGLDEYVKLPDDKKAGLEPPFDTIRREINRQTLVAVIRDSLNRFKQQDYSRLLTQISGWAQQEQDGSGTKGIAEPRGEYVIQNRLQVSFFKPYLADETDVDQYLAQLKEAMLAAINEGKRIQI